MIYLLSRDQTDIGYDEFDSKIVRAESEIEARELANKYVGDEGKCWTDTERVTCRVVEAIGEPMVLISSFNAG